MMLKKSFIIFIFSTYLLTAQNTNVALGKPTLADSTLDENESSKAVDGDSFRGLSRWVSAGTAWPHYIDVDLEATYEIEQLKFWTGGGGDAAYARSVLFEFQVWDGSNWITVVDGSSNTSAIIDTNFPKVTTSKVRLYGIGGAPGGGAGAYFRIYELEVYGTPIEVDPNEPGDGNPGDGNPTDEITSIWKTNGSDIYYTDGNVGIGTDIPDSELTVKGKIHTREVKVDLKGALAPDYVFYSDYKLKPLNEVQLYISKHGHLPNIPSAKEMELEGIYLKEMNLKLLEKIEELTLYILDQNEKQIKLEKRIENLEK